MPTRQHLNDDEKPETEAHREDVRRALSDREGWDSYRRVVLQDLQEIKAELKEVKRDVITLKIKAAAWGFVSGSVSAIGAALLQFLGRGH